MLNKPTLGSGARFGSLSFLTDPSRAAPTANCTMPVVKNTVPETPVITLKTIKAAPTSSSRSCGQSGPTPAATEFSLHTPPISDSTQTPIPEVATPTLPRTLSPVATLQMIDEDTSARPTSLVATELIWHEQVEQAKDDLARRLSIEANRIEVAEVQQVVWSDSSLGCPRSGMAYTQVQRDGLLIRLRVGEIVYNYHSGGGRTPFLCDLK